MKIHLVRAALAAVVIATSYAEARAGCVPVTPTTPIRPTSECEETNILGSHTGWDAACLAWILHDSAYFEIPLIDVPMTPLRTFVESEPGEVAALLAQIDYGIAVQRFLASQSNFLTDEARLFVEGLTSTTSRAQTWLAAALSVSEAFSATVLTTLSQIQSALEVVLLFIHLDAAPELRFLLDWYIDSRSNAFNPLSPERAWQDLVAQPWFEVHVQDVLFATGLNRDQLFALFESSYDAYRRVACSDSLSLRRETGRTIVRQAVPPQAMNFEINAGAATAFSRTVELTFDPSYYQDIEDYCASETQPFSSSCWKRDSRYWGNSFTLSPGDGPKTIYLKVRNSAGLESDTVEASITLEEVPAPVVSYFAINSGANVTAKRLVVLNSGASAGAVEYTASESEHFSGSWKAYSPSVTFELSPGSGEKTVFFKVRNSVEVESAPVNATIEVSDVAIAAPSLSQPASGASGVATDPTLSWGAVGDATEYRLQLTADAAFDTDVTDRICFNCVVNEVVDGSVAELAVSGLAPDTRYYWRARAGNYLLGLTGPWSGVRTFRTGSGPPPTSTPVPPTPTVGPEHTIEFRSGPSSGFNPVTAGSVANLGVLAEDSLGHGLSYFWSADCPELSASGAFSDRTNRGPIWSPPLNPTGSVTFCDITVEVSDGFGISEARSFTQGVGPSNHTILALAGPGGAHNPVPSGSATIVSIDPYDTYGHGVSVAWSASCPTLGSDGTFGNANSPASSWTAPANLTNTEEVCRIQVDLDDGAGFASFLSYDQRVSPQGLTTLSVNLTGSGVVTDSHGSQPCFAGTCTTAGWSPSTQITLTPRPASGWRFDSWTGDCIGNGGCTVGMEQSRNIGATFVPTTSRVGNWILQNSGTTLTLHAVHFINELEGWAVGQAGIALRTRDGGNSWQKLPAPSGIEDGELRGLVASNSTNVGAGGLIGGQGFVSMSINGGDSWREVYRGSQVWGLGIVGNEVWAGTRTGMARSFDAGATWFFGSPEWLFDVHPTNGDLALGINSSTHVVRTEDGGIAWQPTYTTPVIDGLDVVDNRAWGVGSAPSSIIYSADGGATWQTQVSHFPHNLHAVSFMDALNGWAVGDDGAIVSTTSAGQPWRLESGPTARYLRDVHFLAEGVGWAVGDGGTIAKYVGPIPTAPTPTTTATMPPTETAIPTTTPTQTVTASETSTETVTTTRTHTRTPTHTQNPTHTQTPTRTMTSTATPRTGEIWGTIRYESSAAPVAGAVVELQGPDGLLSLVTLADGSYRASGLSAGSWRVQPKKDGGQAQAVSSLDAAYVLQHVVGLRELTGAARVAADVTADGTVSGLDATRLLQYELNLIPQLPVSSSCGSDFGFLPVDHEIAARQLADPQISQGACAPGAAIIDLADAVEQQDFVAVVFGDCTANWRD